MPTYPLSHTDDTGLDVYVFPDDQDLDDWDTYAVQLVEGSGSNTGRYEGNVDSDNGTLWRGFYSATQPASWEESFAVFPLASAILQASVDAVPATLTSAHGAGSWVDTGTEDLSDLQDGIDTLLARVPGVLTGTDIGIINPISSEDEMTLERGVDYTSSSGNAPTKSGSGWTEATWADCTGIFRYRQAGQTVEAGEVTITQDDDTITATLELTAADTDAMLAGVSGSYEIDLTTEDEQQVRRIARGKLIIKDRVPNANST